MEEPFKTMDYSPLIADWRSKKIPWLYGPSYTRCPLRIVDYFGVSDDLPVPRRESAWLYGYHFVSPVPSDTYTVVMDAGFVLSPEMRIIVSTPSNAFVVATGRSEGVTKR